MDSAQTGVSSESDTEPRRALWTSLGELFLAALAVFLRFRASIFQCLVQRLVGESDSIV